jgi:DNA mismatch endonuclease (patch repair protein)
MPFDNVPSVTRARMSRIRKTGSKPEVRVRQAAHQLGYRFRINRRDLPGTPDIVFPRFRKIILVHGCFWHQHRGCRHANLPRTREEYWLPKLRRTQQRDNQVLADLVQLGWGVLVLWECELGDDEHLQGAVQEFLEEPPSTGANFP